MSLFYIWTNGTLRQGGPSAGKRHGDACVGQQAPPSPISPNVVTVAVVESRASVITGRLRGVSVGIMLDSGSSISLVQRDVLLQAQDVVQVEATRSLQLVTASGEQLSIVCHLLCHIRAPVKLGELKLLNDFVVLEHLVTPVILWVDFLHENALVLDFTQSPVVVRHTKPSLLPQPQVSLISGQMQVLPLYEAERSTQARGHVQL